MTQLTIKKINSYLNEHNPKVLVKSGLNKYTTDLASVVFRNGVSQYAVDVFDAYLNTYVNNTFYIKEATGWTDGFEQTDYDDVEFVKINQSYWLKQD
jgi:predicted metal-dependent phosphoesterase TrpH|tara:strand:- start:403 stop:693 length:291 start_codon:yes stop_codon:yes gene_type:complete